MSFRSDGFFAKTRRWFSSGDVETPAARTPVTRSAAASRRSSFDRVDSMVQTDTTLKESPIVAPRVEAGVVAGNRVRVADESPARFPRAVPDLDDTGSSDGRRTPRREDSPSRQPQVPEVERVRDGAEGTPTTPTHLKVEFSLPNC